MSRSIDIASATIVKENDWLVVYYIREDYTMEIEDVNEMLEATNKLFQGAPHAVLVIPQKRSAATHDAMKYAANLAHDNRIAEASVVTSLSTRLLSKFYHAVIRPKVPGKYFGNEEAARIYLEEMRSAYLERHNLKALTE